jgi:DNA repair protein RadC
MEPLRQKVDLQGITSLSNEELLALVLHGRNSANNSLHLAEMVLSYFEKLEGVANATPEGLYQLDGITPNLAYRILAAIELGQRLATPTPHDRVTIRRPMDAVRLIEKQLKTIHQEQLIVILLDTNNRVVGIETIYIGSLNTTIVRIAEVFRPAIAYNCAGIIIAHNHPSGDATPSIEDIRLTTQLVEAGKLLDIAVLDHLIIGNAVWISLREQKQGFG